MKRKRLIYLSEVYDIYDLWLWFIERVLSPTIDLQIWWGYRSNKFKSRIKMVAGVITGFIIGMIFNLLR